MTERSDQTPTKTPWGLVILLGTLTAFAPMSIDMYLPSLPAIGKSLSASAGETQATVSAFLAGMAIGQVLYGPASDRLGRRLPIFIGSAVYVAASAACALATSPQMLIGARFVQALGGCAGAVVARAVVRDRFDHVETARMLSLLMLVMGLAPILAPLAGGAILLAAGWRAIFWVLVAFGASVGLASYLGLAESRSDETARQARAEHPLRAYLALLGQRRLVGYGLAGACNGAALFTYISTSPDLLIGAYHVPAGQFGLLFGLNAAGLIGAGQINRMILRRTTPDRVLRVSSVASTAIAAVLVLAAFAGLGGPWTVLPLLFLLLASYGFVQGNATAGALSVDPLRTGSTSALFGAASFATGALASSISGLLYDGTARPMALIMFAAMAGSTLALRVLALPLERPAQAR
ncbi:multidrug effflux MFS transporter [Phenylobacterium sp.]|uniref:multidrug effflux MFS transporter n=1 Tax=Phenylobacterium sp. TaxID=1871053 RepID=UPI0035AEEA9B